ncbi:MAG: DUF4399 domain-containing protein [Gammaproteobacteria bacterium]
MKLSRLAATAAVIFFSGVLCAQDFPSTPSPAGAEAYFISPKDGENVGETFTIRFGLKGMGVAPAGIDRENTGHHHLIIDGKNLPILSKPMPLGTEVRHFGGGQTETEITLPPGEHTLQLILGDKQHIPHNPPVISDQIKIKVK